jgi:TPR repeat protein
MFPRFRQRCLLAFVLSLAGVICLASDGKIEETRTVLLQHAAEQGNAGAQYNLALLYEEGRGVPQSMGEAWRWYAKAAEQGHPEAQNNLGRLYATGQGVPADVQRAAYWYEKAADQGNVEAENNLADAYRAGRGELCNMDKAFALYQAAAISGYAVAQHNLALMYANGNGTARNLAKAYAWLSEAAAELPSSAALLQKVRGKISAEDLQAGEQFKAELRRTLTANRAADK